MDEGIPLAVKASRKALHEAQLSALDITHVVSTTCTHSANPGFDHFLCKELGMTQPVEKVLLHGIGCSGGLAALRTAANIALGSSFRKKKARVLVVALEISSIMVRSELDSMDKLQECRIGITLFSDCASAVVLSNGVDDHAEPVYDLLGWEHRIVPILKQILDLMSIHSVRIPFVRVWLCRLEMKLNELLTRMRHQAGKSFSRLAYQN